MFSFPRFKYLIVPSLPSNGILLISYLDMIKKKKKAATRYKKAHYLPGPLKSNLV